MRGSYINFWETIVIDDRARLIGSVRWSGLRRVTSHLNRLADFSSEVDAVPDREAIANTGIARHEATGEVRADKVREAA